MTTAPRAVGIAAPHRAATAFAEQVVARGGNAIDAALAAAITLTVVYPHNTGVGGDLIALVRTADGTIHCINASGPAPARTDVTALRRVHDHRMPITGLDTATVPGVVAGWAAIHALGAVLPWPELFAAAIGYAEQGVPVATSLAIAIDELWAIDDLDPGLAAVFRPTGPRLGEGAILTQPALAGTLRELATQGPDALYGGRLGAQLVAGLTRLGGRFDLDDLARFTVEQPAPLSLDFAGRTVWTAPPNSQGFALLQTLGAIGHVDGDPRALLSTDATVLAALFQQGELDRDRYLADPNRAEVDVDALLADSRLAGLAQAARTGGRRSPSAPAPRATGDTVAVTAVDDEGTAVSILQSLFHSFGALVCEPETGIVLHNRGALFSLDADSPNLIAGGKRPAHTLTPMLVTRRDRLELAGGTMGGRAQPQILTQLLLRAFTGEELVPALDAARFVVSDGAVGVEDPATHPAMADLTAGGWDVVPLTQHDESAGHAQFVGLGDDGRLSAASDPRADGAGVVALGPRT